MSWFESIQISSYIRHHIVHINVDVRYQFSFEVEAVHMSSQPPAVAPHIGCSRGGGALHYYPFKRSWLQGWPSGEEQRRHQRLPLPTGVPHSRHQCYTFTSPCHLAQSRDTPSTFNLCCPFLQPLVSGILVSLLPNKPFIKVCSRF